MGPYLTTIADILDLDPVGALSDGNALMAGNLSDRNPKIYRLEPPLFALIQKRGDVSDDEMFHTFNMGLGLLLVVPPAEAGRAIEQLHRAGERAWPVGTIVAGSCGVDLDA